HSIVVVYCRVVLSISLSFLFPFFFFIHPRTTEIYTLSLHDALPICWSTIVLMVSLSWRISPLTSTVIFFDRSPLAMAVATSAMLDRKSTRLNSSHEWISYAVFCLKKKTQNQRSILNRRCMDCRRLPQ